MSLLLLEPLWDVLVGSEPGWLKKIVNQKGELLSFIAANLFVLSILSRKVEDSVFDTERMATIAAVLVGYAAAISYFDPDKRNRSFLFLVERATAPYSLGLHN